MFKKKRYVKEHQEQNIQKSDVIRWETFKNQQENLIIFIKKSTIRNEIDMGYMKLFFTEGVVRQVNEISFRKLSSGCRKKTSGRQGNLGERRMKHLDNSCWLSIKGKFKCLETDEKSLGELRQLR